MIIVTYLQYSPIRISLAFLLATIFPFGIDGNIDEKHLVPRIPTKDYSSFQILFINHSPPLIYLNVLFVKLSFYVVILPNIMYSYQTCPIVMLLFFMPNFSMSKVLVTNFIASNSTTTNSY